MRYLITGGTGSLGKALIKRLVNENDIIVYSRDEGKQATLFPGTPLYKVIGDVRDYEKLDATMKIYRPDYVIHTAALKRVDDMELHPDECVKTNIEGSRNVALASLNNGVGKCILISTDKACQPVNVYGSSKFIAERIFTNLDSNSPETIFTSVRYGNVIASRGSFIPLWINNIEHGYPVSVTSLDCTRFLFTLNDAVDTVLEALALAHGGEVFIPFIKSYTISNVLLAMERITQQTFDIDSIGLRPGEKIHEDMLAETELPNTFHANKTLRVLPQYSKRKIVMKSEDRYIGKRLNSALHIDNSVDNLIALINRGLDDVQ